MSSFNPFAKKDKDDASKSEVVSAKKEDEKKPDAKKNDEEQPNEVVAEPAQEDHKNNIC